jgi:hypothetical protein
LSEGFEMADNKRNPSNNNTSLRIPSDSFKQLSEGWKKTGESASNDFSRVKSAVGKFYKSLPNIGLESTLRQPPVRTDIPSPAIDIKQNFNELPDIGYQRGVEAAKRKLGGAIRSAIQDTSSSAQSAYRNSPDIGLEATLSGLSDQMTARPVKEFQGPIQRPASMSDLGYLPRDVYDGVSAGLTRKVKGAGQGLSDALDNSILGYSPDREYGRETPPQQIRRGLGDLSEYTGAGNFARSLYREFPSFGPSRFAVRQPPQQRGPYRNITDYSPSGVGVNEPTGSEPQQRGASGSSAIGLEPQQRGQIGRAHV